MSVAPSVLSLSCPEPSAFITYISTLPSRREPNAILLTRPVTLTRPNLVAALDPEPLETVRLTVNRPPPIVSVL